MIIHDFTHKNSLLNQFISELRDVDIQKDSMRFRKNIERVGQILAFELSKALTYISLEVKTPLGEKEMMIPSDEIVICSVLRAGLPLHQGLLNYFDKAENAFISAYRQHRDDQDAFEVMVNYFAAPSLEGKTLILTDPMLATGKTLENVRKVLIQHGEPKQIHIISVIGSQHGVDYIQSIFSEKTQLWIAAIDPILNEKAYIVPGLGDAGDLSFGLKL